MRLGTAAAGFSCLDWRAHMPEHARHCPWLLYRAPAAPSARRSPIPCGAAAQALMALVVANARALNEQRGLLGAFTWIGDRLLYWAHLQRSNTIEGARRGTSAGCRGWSAPDPPTLNAQVPRRLAGGIVGVAGWRLPKPAASRQRRCRSRTPSCSRPQHRALCPPPLQAPAATSRSTTTPATPCERSVGRRPPVHGPGACSAARPRRVGRQLARHAAGR